MRAGRRRTVRAPAAGSARCAVSARCSAVAGISAATGRYDGLVHIQRWPAVASGTASRIVAWRRETASGPIASWRRGSPTRGRSLRRPRCRTRRRRPMRGVARAGWREVAVRSGGLPAARARAWWRERPLITALIRPGSCVAIRRARRRRKRVPAGPRRSGSLSATVILRTVRIAPRCARCILSRTIQTCGCLHPVRTDIRRSIVRLGASRDDATTPGRAEKSL